MSLKSIILSILISLLSFTASAETIEALLTKLPGQWADSEDGAAGLSLKFNSYRPDQPWSILTGELTGQNRDPLKLEFLTNKPTGLNNVVYFLRVTNLNSKNVEIYTFTQEHADKNKNFDFWTHILTSENSFFSAKGLRFSFADDGFHKNALLFAWFGGNGYCTVDGQTELCESGQYNPRWLKKEI